MTFLDILPYLISILLAILSSIVSIAISRLQYKNELANYKKQNIYDIKKTAIIDALAFIDEYCSWLTIDNGIKPHRRIIKEDELTFVARKCYNELSLFVDDGEMLKVFLDIVINKDGNIFTKIIQFKKMARKELGMNNIEFDMDRIFIAQVSTKDLSNK